MVNTIDYSSDQRARSFELIVVVSFRLSAVQKQKSWEGRLHGHDE